MQWSELHVGHWIDWAIKEFQLESVDPENFRINGKMLCEMTHPEFVKLIPFDRGDIFWTHLWECSNTIRLLAVLSRDNKESLVINFLYQCLLGVQQHYKTFGSESTDTKD
jgi:hypothetical protein